MISLWLEQCKFYEFDLYDLCFVFQVFHICLPLEDDFGQITETAHWSFICGNGTIFDQQLLVCNYPQDSLPCDQAESFYNLVEFGKIDSDYY